MSQVFVFGDSIAWGAWDLEGGGWVERLRRGINRYQCGRNDFWCPVYNLGIPGDTAAGVAARIEAELHVRRDPKERAGIVIAIGVNDSILHLSDPSLDIPAAAFRRSLERILSAAGESDPPVACVGLLPVQEHKLSPLPWDAGKAYRLARVEEFNRIVMSFARAAGCGFVDMWEDWKNADLESLLPDGLHPNAAGHQRIAQLVMERLKELGVIDKAVPDLSFHSGLCSP